MTAEEYKKNFIEPNEVQLGILVDGQKVPFVIKNTGPNDIYSSKLSCGCIGQAITSSKEINVDLTAKHTGTFKDLYFIDGKPYDKLSPTKFYNVLDKSVLDNPPEIGTPKSAAVFDRYITVNMEDLGQPDEIRNEKNETVTNPNRLKFTVPVKAFVLAKE